MLNVALVFLFCVSTFIRRCDVAQVFYLSDVNIPGTTHKQLTSNPAVDTNSTGWKIVDAAQVAYYTGFPAWAALSSGFIINAYNFNASHPVPTSSEFGSGFRTLNKLNGLLSNSNGTLRVRLHGDMHNLSSATITGKLTARVYKGMGESLFQAHEITNALGISTAFTINNNGVVDVTIPLGFNSSAKLDSEYLFIVMGIEIDSYSIAVGGANNSFDVVIDYGNPTNVSLPLTGNSQASETICAPYGHSEMYIYISPDGEQYPLDVDGSRVVLNDQGTGTPAFEYVTQRGPFQHGETLVDFHARPRTVQLMINQTYNNRDSYWNGRRNLLTQLSPRKQATDGAVAQGVLRRILSTGERRDLNCLIVEGPKFEPRHEDAWQEFSYTEALRFQAFDPIYFDPILRKYIFDKQGSQLIFPATFPITFTTIMQDIVIGYAGSWLTYPTFVINGPMTFFNVVNNSTGEKIEIDYDLAAGETITVNLQYGNKQVTKNDGTSLMTAVSSDSDIGTFHLTETNGGINAMHVHMIGVMSPSQVTMQWYDKYVGL